MKRFLLPFLLICAAFGTVRSEPPRQAHEELVQLIADIPSAGDLRLMYATIRDKESPAFRVADEQSKLAKAKGSVLKLRKLLKVGTNVFDYPGLIAKGGPLDYQSFRTGGQYTFRIGVASGGEGFISPYEFGLQLNDKGQITEVYDIVYK